ncbi:SDR family oxidoreductase [Evansella sp. AB-P1]|uniref:elongation factor P 5-aminopentanone reductase n=1 Tax=Evansella sp. AB-P1 TaxID=3037653 RepID=UPI00241F39DD|nr:SDR family oxidoreductase [Evansella sp. AB-P1]MDG5789012.1 SDR family oxidoreductase [Evansella sp. AB-P1]
MDEKPVAFISGATGEIGRAIAEKLASDGYKLILHYNKNEEFAYELKQKLVAKYDTACFLIQGDFSNSKDIINKVNNINLSPDIVIHNSGTSSVGLITDVTNEEVCRELTIGVTTPFLLTQTFLPAMIRKKQGKIIVISSIWGITGASCEVLYSTIKGAMNTFVKALAKEVAPSQIQVNGIAPGAVKTSMLSHLSKEELMELEEEIPAGRLGTPEDVAATVSFLASKESEYINGQIISVNGAWYC